MKEAYWVKELTAWAIVDGVSNVVVLEVTSEGYANFLCDKLNKGVSLEEVQSRPAPDVEYFDSPFNSAKYDS